MYCQGYVFLRSTYSLYCLYGPNVRHEPPPRNLIGQHQRRAWFPSTLSCPFSRPSPILPIAPHPPPISFSPSFLPPDPINNRFSWL